MNFTRYRIEEIKTIENSFDILKLTDKDVVLKRNDYLKNENYLYFVEEGSLKISVVGEEGEKITRFGYQGDWVVFLDSFLTHKPSDFTIQAIKHTKLKAVSKQEFMNFIKSGNQNYWTTILEDLILQQLEREKDLLIVSPKERYERVLARSPKLFQEIPHKYIANYLCMSPETLSRLKKS